MLPPPLEEREEEEELGFERGGVHIYIMMGYPVELDLLRVDLFIRRHAL